MQIPAAQYWFSFSVVYQLASSFIALGLAVYSIKTTARRGSMVGLVVVLIVLTLAGWLSFARQEEKNANLTTHQEEQDESIKRLLAGINRVADLGPVVDLLSQQHESDEKAFAVRRAIIAQWQRIKEAIAVLEQSGTKISARDRQAAAERILDDLEIIERSAAVIPFAQGNGLVLEVGPNMFRVTFPEPMRAVPSATIQDAPSGAKAKVEEISNVGATIVFSPLSAPVSLQEFLALRPQFSADF